MRTSRQRQHALPASSLETRRTGCDPGQRATSANRGAARCVSGSSGTHSHPINVRSRLQRNHPPMSRDTVIAARMGVAPSTTCAGGGYVTRPTHGSFDARDASVHLSGFDAHTSSGNPDCTVRRWP